MKNKSTFNRNLDKAILSLLNCIDIDFNLLKFRLIPMEEGIGKESSKDNWMKAVLKNNNIEEIKSYDNIINILSAGDSNYPLWINMTNINDEIIQLEFSTRFRHIKTSQNQ